MWGYSQGSLENESVLPALSPSGALAQTIPRRIISSATPQALSSSRVTGSKPNAREWGEATGLLSMRSTAIPNSAKAAATANPTGPAPTTRTCSFLNTMITHLSTAGAESGDNDALVGDSRFHAL